VKNLRTILLVAYVFVAPNKARPGRYHCRPLSPEPATAKSGFRADKRPTSAIELAGGCTAEEFQEIVAAGERMPNPRAVPHHWKHSTRRYLALNDSEG